MANKRPRRASNPDLRRQTQMPAPPNEEIERQLLLLLQPENFTPLHLLRGKDEQKLRSRILTLPVMMAVVVSMVYRQIAGIRELSRMLSEEGLFWLSPMNVSPQALSKRLRTLPVELFSQIFEQVMMRICQQQGNLPIPEQWLASHQRFAVIWIADGSTLEQLRKKLQTLKAQPTVLAGKMMMVVEAFTHRPVTTWYSQNAKANDKIFCDQLLERLPVGGLLIFDLGFFKFPWFDAFSQDKKFFVTRLREKTTYELQRCLSQGQYYRDEIIQMGEYRSNPCQYPTRLVSVLWGQSWYYYLTNVLDPNLLSAQQVCELYRRRWQVEDAFLLTKRLLGLAYLWVGDSNGVQIQIYATWIFYAVLNQLCSDVAVALNQPKDSISMEMVFRSLYHYGRALLRGDNSELVSYLAARHQLFGLVKAKRERHRQIDARTQQIWALAP
jgi:hypothetical protein